MDRGRGLRARAPYGWLLGLWTVGAVAGTPHLVRDINAHFIPISSSPTDFIDFGATSYFDANDGVIGYEPWTTDGTTAGTFQWGDVTEGVAGAIQRQPVRAGGQTFLTHNALTGAGEIWVAGATRQSVRRIATPELAALNLSVVGALGDVLIFTGSNPAAGVRMLWSSDGTEAGTRSIPSANGDVYSFVDQALFVGSRLYFFSNGSGNAFQPWVSDGTPAGTHGLAQIPNAGPNPNGIPRMTRVGNFALFAFETTDSGTELWRIDLSNDALSRVADLAPGAASSMQQGEQLRNVNGVAIFSASATGDNNRTTWRTDGTGAGTFQIANAAMLEDSESAYLGASDVPRLMFRVVVGLGADTWTTDGSIANTALLRNGGLGGLQRIGQRYYFTLGDVDQLWTTDGTAAGTRMLNGILTGGARVRDVTGDDTAIYVRSTALGTGLDGSIYRHVVASGATSLITNWTSTTSGLGPSVFSVAQGRLYFDNEDAVNGRELWISDGTPVGTRLLVNLAPEQQTQDSVPADFVRFNDALYFTADDGSNGREVWRSDGTEAGTNLFFDARPGATGSEPTALFVALNRLFFFARDGAGTYRLWSWDGIARAPQPLVAAAPLLNFPVNTSCDSTGVVVNGEVLFRAFAPSGAFPMQLWATNGTSAGTRIVADLGPGISGTCERVAVGNRLYFQGTGIGGGLWVSDGSSAALLADVASGPIASMARNLIERNGKLYFIAQDTNSLQRFWTTDGTLAGTTVVDVFPGLPSSAYGPIGTGLLTFVSENENGVLAARPWTTDGTSATRLSSELRLQAGPAFVNRGKGYFSAFAGNSAPFGLGPAVTDGTVAGTRLLVNLPGGVLVHSFTDFDGITFFQTNHFTGQQLWRTDGTAAGTRHVADVGVGLSRAAANHSLFYVAFAAAAGAELFAIDNTRPVAVNDSLGSVQAGNSINANVLANDTDADGALDPGSIAILTQPAGGSASVAANGTITYSARNGFAGADAFTYSIADDQAYASSPATVQVTVTAAPAPPSPPSQGGGGGGGGAMQAIELLSLLLMLLVARTAGAFRGYASSSGSSGGIRSS